MTATLDQAVTLHRAGRVSDAVRCYEQVIAADPNSAAARHGLALLLLQSGDASGALTHLEVVVEAGTADAHLYNSLGVVRQRLGDLEQACAAFEQALAIDPDHSKALANFGVCHYLRDDFSVSANALARAAHLDPGNAETKFNYARTLRALGQLQEAERELRGALDITPGHVAAHVDLGVTVMAQGRREEAEQQYRKALAIDPNALEAHHFLAHLLLDSGRLEEGWPHFEWRWRTPDFLSAESFDEFPPWDGAALEQGALLVWAEQGIGDQIMYASMLPDLLDSVPHVVIACADNLVPLLARSFPAARVLSMAHAKKNPDELKDVAAQVPFGSLCRFLRPNMAAFSSRQSFLIADPDHVSKLRAAYTKDLGEKKRVGLSWRSKNARTGEAQSLNLADLVGAFSKTNAAYVDLQYGETDADRAAARKAGLEVFKDPGIDPLTDLDGFAAQVAAMDLVITISNTTAHVAGALGVPCWVLVAAGEGQNWYWFLDRSDSPWYPSLRLFRQATPGQWADTIKDVGGALSSWSP